MQSWSLPIDNELIRVIEKRKVNRDSENSPESRNLRGTKKDIQLQLNDTESILWENVNYKYSVAKLYNNEIENKEAYK